MKNFAILDDENKVTNVIVIDDADVDSNGGDYSVGAEDFVKQTYKYSNVKQFSADGSVRHNPAAKGGEYDAANDAFILPKPFPSWNLNSEYQWEAPVAHPDDGQAYSWNEANQSWDLLVL